VNPVHASDLEWQHPILHDYVSICLLPSNESDHNDEVLLKLWNGIVGQINEKYDIIIFYVPRNEELRLIFEKGFERFEDKDHVSANIPYIDFWQKHDIQYIVFGNKKIENEITWLEIQIYSTLDGRRLLGKKYTGYEHDLENLFKKVTTSILQVLGKSP